MPSLDSLAPLALVVAFFVLLAPMMPSRAPWARRLVIAALAFVTAHYLAWRVPVTVLPATSLDLESLWIWTCFAIEMLALCDAAILFATLLRRRDRKAETDARQARLRARPPEEIPEVDVLIPTYNEGLDVLEKTITGALFLDWPADKLNVWVLDDSNRPWLRAFCARKGAGYLTREGNAHAKAGNVNAALKRTRAPFFAIFDADFIPRADFLTRMMGYFDDPEIGIVQAPHHFFNHDPMQANLALRRTLPDDQRLFFDEIMAGRDGWNCAFCCGSNSITRRAALEAIGGELPTDSITEDMLLTMALLRKGYVTRYVNEKLAIGLAPESLDAFFVQRGRWARGALQILYLAKGPFGPGLSLMQRLLFLPTHWLTQSLCQLSALLIPAIFLLTDVAPLKNADVDTVFYYQVPAIVAVMATMRFFAPGAYFPLAATVLGALQCFRLFPTVLATLVKPFGHAFKVTPKGKDAGGVTIDFATIKVAGGLLALTGGGLLINAGYEWRIVEHAALIPVVAFWSVFNMVVLLLVCCMAVSAPAHRTEERFEVREAGSVRGPAGTASVEIRDLSLSGALLVDPSLAGAARRGDWLWLDVPEVGEVPAEVMRVFGDRVGLRFYLPESEARDLLIRKLFTCGLDNATRNENGLEIAFGMLSRIFAPDPPPPPKTVNAAFSEDAPEAIRAEFSGRPHRLTSEVAALRRAA